MLPEPFCKRMEAMLGEDYPAFMETYNQDKYQALRINQLKKYNSMEAVSEQILSAVFHLSRVPWAENGYYYEKEDSPGKHVLHQAGAYYIQEPSAMAPVGLLEVKPGELICDLCAAPGGKSTQIAALLKGQGFLLTNEIHPQRARILSENVERMGITNACVCNETPAHLAEQLPAFFHGILVDAPCSGEGMFRKNEDAGLEWSPENVALCAERQREILDCAAIMLQPGGRLVYSTCTFAPEENEEMIQWFLETHPEFTMGKIDKELFYPEGTREYASSMEGALRLYPHLLKGEGHFCAILHKTGELFANAPRGAVTRLSARELTDWEDFCQETIRQRELFRDGVFLKFGDNLYCAPAAMPGLRGLKVLRPGLHLGESKKNRFEPSHSLALALNPEQVYHYVNLEEEQAKQYLQGMSFPMEGEKGWYLVCFQGLSLGWGKLAGNMLKNHYPKGLRR